MIECMEKNELKEKVLDYASKVFFYCVKRCNTRMDAEDLSQTILLKVIENIDKGARIENLDYYIWGVCKNQFNIYLRKTIKDRKNIEYIDDIDYSNESKTSLDEMLENEKIRKMKQAIKLLSKDYTEILYAYYVEDKTLKSIADELELPLGTVTWKLSKIREKLKEYLDMERLDGKKAYVPKYFTSSASYSGELPFNLHETVKHLFVKNLLWHTYDNVCSIEDLSIEMGMAKPYVEDVVNHLLERQFLIQEGNKYKSNVTFIGHDIIKKVDNCMKNYEHIYINEVLKFAKDNLKYYRSMVENKDIPDNLLMWSFLQVIFSYTYIPNITRTKKYNDVEWSFCLYENVKNYNRNDFYMSWNGFGDVEAHNIFGEAYPAGSECCEIIHPVHKRLLATSSINGENLDSYAISKIAYDNLEYSKLDDIWKKEIDNGIKYNICKIENDVVKFIMPCIDIEDFRKLKTLIRNSENLKNTYFELWSKITKLVQNNIPNYLSEEAEFVVATLINPLRSHLMIAAYDNGLLGLDEKHEFFVYNAIIVKTK